MRVYQRYKKFSNNFSPLSCIPKDKILKFHRPKWLKIQKIILKNKLKKNKNEVKFKFFWKAYCQKTRWVRASHIYRNQLLFKKSLHTLFLNSVSNSYLKKKVFKTNTKFFYFQFFLYKLEYRLDILLPRLKILNSSFLVKQSLRKKQIIINNQESKNTISLIKGDIISVLAPKTVYGLQLEDFRLLTPFIEMDPYTNKIVIIKDLKELTEKDFLLLSRDFYNILDLRDYFSN